MADLASAPVERISFSNAVRLSLAQWIGVALFVVAFVVITPRLWTMFEPITRGPDDRLPRALFDDYGFFERYAAQAAAEHDVVLLGDSVIWGEWVARHETLSHYLNAFHGKPRFANLGLNGAHPLALEGLVTHYAAGLQGHKVVLHLNPLWLTSPKTDLQDPDADFNHPRLLPQFLPCIPAYKEEISPRLGVLVERRLALSKWANHLQQAYYRTSDGPSDIPGWTLKHPYANPLEPLTRPLPASDDRGRDDARPWQQRGIAPQDFAWVEPATSLQWPAFQRTIEVLRQRGNSVLVIVGPFNEHLLIPASQQRHEAIRATLSAWLRENQVPHAVPAGLASEQYADASHPLAEGYASLARQLLEEPAFLAFLNP